MADNNFIDYVKLFCRSGKGGAGSQHFERSKGNPKGGPDGGDGGKGGDIILKGNSQLWTLIHLKYRKHIFAEDGKSGGESECTGKSGKSIILEVPLGTIAKNAETGEYIGEITTNGEKIVLMPGGRGGLGNMHFKTSTNQAPTYSQPGELGLEHPLILELKVLADVGLVGFPNAGKSTLLSVISAAKPEIANYAFTTLVPNLGVVEYRDYRSFIVADIPGIIEDAHLGKGLGHRFLRHIERNSVLLFMIPADSDNHLKEYKILLNELKLYNPEMLAKDHVISISKADMLDDELKQEIIAMFSMPIIFFSAVAQQGITELKDLLWNKLNS